MSTIRSDIVEVGLFRLHRDKAEYLLLHRDARDSVYPGIWQILTGTAGEKETALAAAGREILEEIGVAPIRFWVLPQVSSFYDVVRDAIILAPLFAAQLAADAVPILSAEHDRYRWLTIDDACRSVVWPGQRETLRLVHDIVVGGQQAATLVEIPFPAPDGM